MPDALDMTLSSNSDALRFHRNWTPPVLSSHDIRAFANGPASHTTSAKDAAIPISVVPGCASEIDAIRAPPSGVMLMVIRPYDAGFATVRT